MSESWWFCWFSSLREISITRRRLILCVSCVCIGSVANLSLCSSDNSRSMGFDISGECN